MKSLTSPGSTADRISTPRPLRVLLVEDCEDDAEILLRDLRSGHFQPHAQRVDTAAALTAALAAETWDIVIADYAMPRFDGLAALAIVRQSTLDLPFILVSGTIGEDRAVEAMKAGAHDFITKGNLARLLPAIERELADAEVRRRQRRAEAQQTALLAVSEDIAGRLDAAELLERVQQHAVQLLPCDAVMTFGLDRDTDSIRLLSGCGLPATELDPLRALEFPALKPMDGRLGESTTVIINDITEQPWLPASFCATCRLTALIATPLRAKTRHFGTLVACQTQPPRAFEPHQTDLLRGIAGQLAVAMEAAELYRIIQEEAEVSGRLAQLGAELYLTLDTAVLRHQLCRMAADVLGCDRSMTVVWEPRQNAYVPAAFYGHSPEAWQSTRLMMLTPAHMEPLLSRLERHEVAPIGTAQPTAELAALAQRLGLSCGLALALRCGDELIGVQIAGRARAEAHFTRQHKRIAEGLARIASVALANAQMVERLTQENRARSEFVETMTRESRATLHTIVGYTDLVCARELGPLTSEQLDALQRVDKSATALMDRIATVDLSRMEFASTH
ncbi:MAG: GAF domain-containing protein [Deltaproteobacteria bacterium]|nr:GAF domain-containing protein [Deltaproteobacteria bacterium]